GWVKIRWKWWVSFAWKSTLRGKALTMQTRREAAAKRVQELNISERSAFRYADSPERTARIRAARTIARPS
ncbi:hypothetical protein, partial [Delftia tsuruhatensis]|uniref:hypothetical protein n=1 Tax=Delftia tsuruhatensis TaxID=180282 RepID=UPI002028DFA5